MEKEEYYRVLSASRPPSSRLVRFCKGVLRFFSSPEMFYRYGSKLLIHCIYRTDFRGFEQIPETGPALLISNHVSYMDGLILHTACKRPIHFVIDEDIYNIPMVKYFLDMNGAVAIAPNRASVKRALRQVSDLLRAGHLVCVFPEGSLTYTGNMARFRFGIEWMLQNDPVPIVPIALKGLWGSIFSRKYLGQRFAWFPRSLFRKVTAICGAPIPPEQATVSHLQRVLMKLKNSR